MGELFGATEMGFLLPWLLAGSVIPSTLVTSLDYELRSTVSTWEKV